MTQRKRGRRAPTGHLIEGEDSYLRLQQREKIIASSVPEEARGFAVARFSLKDSPLEEVLAQARILPMLSKRQVIVVTEVDAMTEAGLSALEDYLAAPMDSTVLVFETARLDRRTRAARLLLDRCKVHETESPDDRGAVVAATRMADELGVQLDRGTAEELVFALGNDQGRLRGELKKLRAYSGPTAQVTSADVAAIVSAARQFSVFDLADLLAEGRRAEALARLRRLLEAGESPIGIVGLLAWLYRQLIVAQAIPKNTPVWKAAQALRAPRSRVGALLRQAPRFSRQQLSAGMAALLQADVDLKSASTSQDAVLEMLIVRLTESPERVGAAAAKG